MRRHSVPWTVVLAMGLMCPVALFALEPLSEEELDRTVASGVEAPVASRLVTGPEPAFMFSEPGEDGVADAAEEDTSDSDEVTFVAYREALPVVMSRMTNSPRGPLGAHGSYSLSPITVVRDAKPPVNIPVPALKLGPLPPLNRPLFLGR